MCRHLSKTFCVHVLAPHAHGAATEEQLDGIQVTRYRYFISRWQNIAYEGGILANLKQKPIRYGLLPFFILTQLIALVHLLRRYQYDCIHAHWMIPQGLIALIARFFIKSPPPLVVTSHGSDLFSLKGAIFNRLKRFIVLRSAVVTVVSNAMMNAMHQIHVEKNKVHVIPMGVDLQNRFVPNGRRQTTGKLLFVGRLIKNKGITYLIDALPSILEKHPEAVLRIVGEGQEKENITKHISELNLNKNVEFMGPVENDSLPEIYRSSDVVVFPSIFAEGFGLVLVEALGCECATVVTDLPAMRDIIHDGRSALVVHQRDVTQLAQKVILLLKDPKLRQALGKQGRKDVLERFDWEIVTQKYTTLIHSSLRD
jgi:glycosyltransferase involved in cell wall biosynthesis